MPSRSAVLNRVASMAAVALGITSQPWNDLGTGDDPQVAASDRLDVTVERVTSLLLVRIIAWISPRIGQYTDLSATTICRTLLVRQSSAGDDDDDDEGEDINDLLPAQITQDFIVALKLYVQRMLEGYRDVPYHNFQHCYHVVISTNKLIDMALTHSANASSQGQQTQPASTSASSPPNTFGFKDDPLMQLALLFAALVHDVEHQGIPNRQLADEDDILAMQYNDQSIAENRSLYVAFSELLKPDFDLLRSVLFPVPQQDYRRFRKAVVNLVLTTDIASPERTQVGKSRWKEAFGDPYETVERKIRKHMERRQSMAGNSTASGSAIVTQAVANGGARHPPHRRASRRLSTHSIMSELTIETPNRGAHPTSAPTASGVAGIGDTIQLTDPTQQANLDDDESVTDTPESSEHSEDEALAVQARGSAAPSSVPENQQVDGHGQRPQLRPPVTKPSETVPPSGQPPLKPPNKGALRSKRSLGVALGDSRQAPPRARSMDTLSFSSAGVVSAPNVHNNNMALKYHRRLSNVGSGAPPSRFRNQRLGLLRTVDLTGKTIETYASQEQPRTSATGASTAGAASAKQRRAAVRPPEEVDELRETVVMEQLLKAADVAHNLQSWDNMHKYSDRLFMELRRAYVQGRGDDPQDGWYLNQVGFLEAYLLPLARRLDDIGIFGEAIGAEFAKNVESNRDRWMRDGMSVTARVIMAAEEKFPESQSGEQL